MPLANELHPTKNPLRRGLPLLEIFFYIWTIAWNELMYRGGSGVEKKLNAWLQVVQNLENESEIQNKGCVFHIFFVAIYGSP